MKTKNLVIGGAALLAAAGVGAAMLYNQKKTIPKGAKAVKPFDSKLYLGKWYEIARMDFIHEKNLTNATAEYSLNGDGTIKVVNKGYDYKKRKEQKSEGKAKFVADKNEAKLKVSFFGPFYAGYNVIAIDPSYNNALVVGKNKSYMWLLSRDKQMPEEIRKSYLQKAEDLGFNTKKLVWTDHSKC